ncbi:hypothetical protein D9757_005173 [Collybiopsis confluens]|uniref:Dynein heavy chain, cytoplasmic n=1 Tax=Collybiopsis confluens TaxID=2823264 RepID=A0A8H5MDV4_9AGAR|nr:hypothetical protein D9757_005173 [Collybiopsis confluens]
MSPVVVVVWKGEGQMRLGKKKVLLNVLPVSLRPGKEIAFYWNDASLSSGMTFFWEKPEGLERISGSTEYNSLANAVQNPPYPMAEAGPSLPCNCRGRLPHQPICLLKIKPDYPLATSRDVNQAPAKSYFQKIREKGPPPAPAKSYFQQIREKGPPPALKTTFQRFGKKDPLQAPTKTLAERQPLSEKGMISHRKTLLEQQATLKKSCPPDQLVHGKITKSGLRPAAGAVPCNGAGEALEIEVILRSIEELWSKHILEFCINKNGCPLIKTHLRVRGYKDLINQSSEGMENLTNLKQFPHYENVWLDVQRQWVYLEGIFSGSINIKHLLPVKSAHFKNINDKFLSVMKRVYELPLVLEVMNITGIQDRLECLADLLNEIKKVLGEYLDKDILRVMKHLKKMFAGISAMILNDDLTQIQGMALREGEEVRFTAPILLKDFPKINDWLTQIEMLMQVSLANLLSDAVTELHMFYAMGSKLSLEEFVHWMEKYPAQLVTVAVQVAWTASVEDALEMSQAPQLALGTVNQALDLLADIVLEELSPVTRRKCEHLITELVHQRNVTRSLLQERVVDKNSFTWLYQMKFYLDKSISNPLERLSIKAADAAFPYGWEYLGVLDKLVQMPLTDCVYLTFTQALDNQLGGAPFGPAGTGKTESVKALGVQLGQFVLVFCCNENFDFKAMGRIFVGLCQISAWGCFDEFNRLEERILSAVSQQVQPIQQGLAALVKNPNTEIELVGKNLKINKNMVADPAMYHLGIFITTNPTMAMTRPDRELIAQVMLFSQGFRTAESLASKIIPFFNLCDKQLSPQPHYDFGLRALKAVLASAGILKHERLLSTKDADADVAAELSDAISEQIILIQSVTETIVPKLVTDDVLLLTK